MAHYLFEDDLSFDKIYGPLRVYRLISGWYLLGNGLAFQCKTKQEAEELYDKYTAEIEALSQAR